MAIRIADYYPSHIRRVVLAAAAVQVATLVALATLLYLYGFDIVTLIVFVLLPVVLLQTFLLIFTVRFALEPLNILTRAVTHISNQASDVTPPNLNGTRHERTGLKLMVQTIYDLATSSDATPKTETPAGIVTNTAEILDALPCGIIVLDAERNITYANNTAPVHIDEKGIQSIQLQFTGEDSLENWLSSSERTAVNTSKVWSRIQDAVPGESSDRKLFDVYASYAKAQTGGIETVVVTIDKTSSYAVDEEDMDFIALAAHELRGPITVIRGYLDVLGDDLATSLRGDQKELLDRLSVSASRLSGYVSNILNVSRYDRRHLKLHLVEDSFTNVYATIADDLQLRAKTQNRLLSVQIPDTLPTIAADRNSLTEVLANLVDNAIKYSNEGGQIEVTALVDGDFVRCDVSDHGIGMPGSVVGQLFSKFYRSHRSRQTVAGTGLGLYISKAIIDSHGGKIGVKSVEGQGSTFSFSVPIYSTVADKLLSGNEAILQSDNGWIKNHAMYRG